jgi:signal transduction histidine kinase
VTERVRRERELERTNERLDKFVSFVSHDLRNPLNVAMGHLDLAMETGDADSFEAVRQQQKRMETMIDDLLSMARDGADVEETAPVALNPVATRAWESVETDGASLVVVDDPTVVADESRLPNLFENLFRNAVEHGATDPSSLTIRIEGLPDGFAVSDDGVGIGADIADDVTESGYTTEGSNTGYGLAIVSEIATAHGWDLEVTESDDGGARFEFTDADGNTAQRDGTDGGITDNQAKAEGE